MAMAGMGIGSLARSRRQLHVVDTPGLRVLDQEAQRAPMVLGVDPRETLFSGTHALVSISMTLSVISGRPEI